MKTCMKKRSFFVVINAALLSVCNVSTSTADIILNFVDNATITVLNPYPSTATIQGGFTQPFGDTSNGGSIGSEFRMITPVNTIGGGTAENSIIDGGGNEFWAFDEATNNLIGVGTAFPPNSGTAGGTALGASPAFGSNVTLQQESTFKLNDYTFLAPVIGSNAATAYGPGKISIGVTNTTSGSETGFMSVDYPVLEAQWAGNHFPLGLDGNAGITFNSILSNIQLDTPSAGRMTFDFVLYAEHQIQPSEDGSGAFYLWTLQWELHGTGEAPMLIVSPPSVDVGTIAATSPGTSTNDGRVTSVELLGLLGIPDDTAIESTCVGSCWDFTVTGVSNPSVLVTLPLSAPIPSSAVYRKYLNGQWGDFDTSTGDTIESGPGVLGGCGGVVYSPGLNQGDFCVQLTISDGGPNDADGLVDGTVIDPGGIGTRIPQRSSSSSGSGGCSASTSTVRSYHHSDWLIVSVLIIWFGLLYRRNQKDRKI